ncbi:MAG: AAA family ATPase [Candidatus Obscuribacterales bacterium]|nr:AAA family ATPase [Candidatus Obscuribacterales bacterium]
MNIERLHVSGYRSLRNVRLDLKQLNVIVGENGSGKSNLYRALQLLSTAANGRFARDLANEGGMSSALWGGKKSKQEKERPRINVEVEFEELNYKLSFGPPAKSELPGDLAYFSNDPRIKVEEISVNYRGKTNKIIWRKGNMIWAKNIDGRTIEYPLALQGVESVLAGLRDPQKFPELSLLREEFLNWRFYHNFRKDVDSPIRQPQKSVMTTVLSHDGADLAAAMVTIKAIGQPLELENAINDAFPGAMLALSGGDGELELTLDMPELNRLLDASELSDGTLQYLCMVALLMTERPPTLMILNEPEASIHMDLYEPLAKLIVKAAKRSQIILTTHAKSLASFIRKHGETNVIELEKIDGETRIKGAKLVVDDEDQDLDYDNDFEQR